MFSYTVLPQERGRRTVRFLEKMLPEAPSGLLYRFLRTKKIRVNGRHPRPDQILEAGDRIDVYIPDEQAAELGYRGQTAAGTDSARTDAPQPSRAKPADYPQIPVVYEDGNFVLWNKPAGVLCQSDRSGAYSLSEYAADTLSAATYKAGVINRLDRGTTGLVIAARTLACAQSLSEMFRSHGCRKLYLAVCEGECPWDREMWLVHAFRKDSRTNTAHVERIYAGPDRPDLNGLKKQNAGSSGRPVVCRARVLCTGSGRTLFALELIGGQSHQLRAQIAAEGYPISGDRKYAGSRKAAESFKVSHPLLHAYKLLFNGLAEPFAAYNGQIYTAQPPAGMMKALRMINASPDTVLQDAGFAEESNPTAP